MKFFLPLLLLTPLVHCYARDLSKEYQKTKIILNKKVLEVYLADTDERREKGLMFIRELPRDGGMLFVFPQEQPLAFWMKNTLIPLSIGYFDGSGVLVDVQEMSVPPSIMVERPPSYPSKKPAKYALEMSRNWFATNKIRVGAKLTLEKTPRP